MKLWGPACGGMLLLLAGAQTAYADFWGADIPLLTTLVANTTEQIAKANAALETARKSYDDAKRVARYADDAQQAYQHFAKYNAQRFSDDVLNGLDRVFPDITYFRRDASHTGPWAQGTGELQAMVSYCLEGGAKGVKGSCSQLQQTLSLRQVRTAIDQTFGTAPRVAGSIEVRAVDHEAAVAMAASSAQFERNKLSRHESNALLDECRGKNLAACQAAASTAQIRQLSVSADMTDQLAESNRLQAVELSRQNAERKRELGEAVQRRELLLEGTQVLRQKPVEVRTEGFDFFSGSRP